MKRILIVLLLIVLLVGACVLGVYRLAPLLESAWGNMLNELGGALGESLGSQGGSSFEWEDPADDPAPPSKPDAPYDENKTQAQVDATLQQRLLQAITDGRTEVEIEDLGYDSVRLKEQISRFFFSHPALFYVDNSYRYFAEEGSSTVKRVQLTYLYEGVQLQQMNAFYESTVEGIVSGIPVGASDFDKILYLHDYLVQNYAYDYEGLSGTPIRDAYNFFKQGKGVCQAYMLALIALCEKAGIPALPVTSDEMEHAWNLVKLDGEWYHIDVTWDDAGGEQAPVYPSFISYKYFLLSGKALYESGRTAAWYASERAEHTLYDAAPWRGTTTRMLKMGQSYYCALFDTAAKTTKLYGGTPTQMQPVLTLEDAKWYGSPTSFYRTAWAGLAAWQERLLITTATAFFLYDPPSGVLSKVAELSGTLEGNQIFGICGVDADGNVSYVVAKDYHGSYEVRTAQLPVFHNAT